MKNRHQRQALLLWLLTCRPIGIDSSVVRETGEVRRRVADLVQLATDGDVGSDDVLAGQASLPDLGVTSLGYLRLIDALEREFGVDIDTTAPLATLDDVVGQLT
jgi:acyl carrier protein